MATHEIPITWLYGCHNAMKEEMVQDDCRDGEGMRWERQLGPLSRRIKSAAKAEHGNLAEMGASLPVLRISGNGKKDDTDGFKPELASPRQV
jgi:hypothetical protein